MSTNKLGTLTVYDDSSMNHKKIEYRCSATLLQYVSMQSLVEADKANFALDLFHMIAEKFAKMIAKDIQDQLLAEFQPLGASNVKDYQKALYEKLVTGPGPTFTPDMKALLGTWTDTSAKFAPPPKASAGLVENALYKAIPGLKSARVEKGCPECAAFANDPVTEVIVHLNDQHKWTRENIADWLDTLDLDLSFQAPGESHPYAPIDPAKFMPMVMPIMNPKSVITNINPA